MLITVEIPLELAERIDGLLWSADWAAGKVAIECKRFRSFPRELEDLAEKRDEIYKARMELIALYRKNNVDH